MISEELLLQKIGESEYGIVYGNDFFIAVFDKADGHISILLQRPSMTIYACEHTIHVMSSAFIRDLVNLR